MRHHTLKTKATILSILSMTLSFTLISCDKRVGDFLYTCRSNVDCTYSEMRCLPFTSGESLSELCQRAPCPSMEGFQQFVELHKMPKVCDYDRDHDGLSDVGRDYTLISPEDYPEDCTRDCTIDDVSEVIFEREGEVMIFDLFQQRSSCHVGLVTVNELNGICLPPPLSVTFCDQSSACERDKFCSTDSATCEQKRATGELCQANDQCMSERCLEGWCVDRQLGSYCVTDDDCDSTLKCSGQQSVAPGFHGTEGPTFCTDLGLFAPCDPALLPCEEGSCKESRLSRYNTCYIESSTTCATSTRCPEVCETLPESINKLFFCLP